MSENIKFVGIDYWNRPVFKSLDKRMQFYGSVHKLFPAGATETEVLEKVTEKDLCFFGNKFNCEPWGTPTGELKIIKKENI